MKRPIILPDAVAFDEPADSVGSGGKVTTTWGQRHACRAQFIYARGSEAVEAARRDGRSVYKVKIRTCTAARQIKQSWRMRDTRRGVSYNVIEVDAITDREWIYLVVESGKAA